MFFVRYFVFDENTKILYLNDLPIPDSSGNLITRDVIYPEVLSRSKCVKKAAVVFTSSNR